MSDNISPLVMIPVTRIDPHPRNPRRDLGDLGDLVKSIKAQGIRQNLLVVRNGERVVDDEVSGGVRHQGMYTVVIGHRRLAAARQAGLATVPCSVADLTDAQQLELMLVENVQRTDLTPIEEAEGLQGLLDLGVTQAGIAKATGISAKTIKGRLQLLTLPETAQAKIHAGQGTLADAVALEAFADDPEEQERLSEYLGTANFAVRVQEASSRRARMAALQPIIDRLVERGAIKHVRGPGADDVNRKWGGHVQSVDEADQVFLPEGSTYEPSEYTGTVTVFVPVAKVDGDTTPYVDEGRAEREARWEAERVAQAAARVEREDAFAVRNQWVKEFVRGAKPTAKESSAVLAAVGSWLAAGEYLADRYELEEWVTPDDADEDTDYLAAWGAKTAPALVVLTAMHVGLGTSTVMPSHRPVFDALEACGYTPSTIERSWYEPAPEAAPEAAGDE